MNELNMIMNKSFTPFYVKGGNIHSSYTTELFVFPKSSIIIVIIYCIISLESIKSKNAFY